MLIEIKNTAELGALAKAVRKAEGIRQDDIAETIERSHVYVRDIEAGKPQPNIGGILALFNELGVKVHLDVPISESQAKEAVEKTKKIQTDLAEVKKAEFK